MPPKPTKKAETGVSVRLGEILNERGRTLYWLSKESGVPYPVLWRLHAGRTESISFGTIGGLCRTLSCTPGELFSIKRQPQKSAPAKKARPRPGKVGIKSD
jgi:putative transcriptional regulator